MVKKQIIKDLAKPFSVLFFVLLFAAVGFHLLTRSQAATTAYIPQLSRTGTTIGSDSQAFAQNGEPFSATEYDQIVANYGMVHFPHDGILSVSANAQKAAKQLAARNASIKVFAYMNTQFWFKGNDWSPAQFNTAWYLHDNDGNLIPDQKGCTSRCNYYLDLANPDYRAWARNVAISWMNAAPFAGVKFDHADFIGDSSDPTDHDTKMWASLLCPAGYVPTANNMPADACPRVKAFNAGIVDLLSTTHQALHAIGKLVMFNGIAPGSKRLNRDASYFDFTDGAMDEAFCLDNSGLPNVPVAADLTFINQHLNKLYLLHSTYHDDANKIYGPYCFAEFMMIWQPGYTNWHFGSGYGVEQLAYQLPDSNLNLGSPTGLFHQNGSLYWRQFQNGIVYLNTGSSAVSTTLPSNLTRYAGGNQLENHTSGSSYSVGAQSASLFLYTGTPPADSGGGGSIISPGIGGTSSTGSTDGGGNSSSSTGSTPTAVNTLRDIPSVLAHDILHPTNIPNTLRQTSNKWYLLPLVAAYAIFLMIILVPLYLLANRYHLLQPINFAFARVKSKIFPPRWK